jgi:hypothetical protein
MLYTFRISRDGAEPVGRERRITDGSGFLDQEGLAKAYSHLMRSESVKPSDGQRHTMWIGVQKRAAGMYRENRKPEASAVTRGFLNLDLGHPFLFSCFPDSSTLREV